jgi:hypothetical protein
MQSENSCQADELIELKFCKVSQKKISAFYLEKQKGFIPKNI